MVPTSLLLLSDSGDAPFICSNSVEHNSRVELQNVQVPIATGSDATDTKQIDEPLVHKKLYYKELIAIEKYH